MGARGERMVSSKHSSQGKSIAAWWWDLVVVKMYYHPALWAGTQENQETMTDATCLWATVRHTWGSRGMRNKGAKAVKMSSNSYQLLRLHVHSPLLSSLVTVTHVILITLCHRHRGIIKWVNQGQRGWATFPKLHVGESNVSALNTDASAPEALCFPSILLSNWGNAMWIVALSQTIFLATDYSQACWRHLVCVFLLFQISFIHH